MLLCLTQQIIHQNNQQKSENELQMLNHMINKVREVRDAFHIAYFFILMYPVNTQCV